MGKLKQVLKIFDDYEKAASKTAAKDPAKRASSHMLASRAGLGTGLAGGAALVPQEAEAGWVDKAGKRILEAYHGSPHDFDKFDISKIGTGEGFQKYGHGLYFADNPNVAADYRRKLSSVKAGEHVSDGSGSAMDNALSQIAYVGGDIGKAKKNIDMNISISKGEQKKIWEEIREAVDIAEKEGVDIGGSLYKTHIDVQPDELLDWDKPLSEQPDILKRFADIWEEPLPNAEEKYGDMWFSLKDLVSEEFVNEVVDSSSLKRMTGRDLNQAILDNEIFEQIGIKGIQYDDAMSRGTEGGTKNYVIFDDTLIEIIEKNGLTVEQVDKVAAEKGISRTMAVNMMLGGGLFAGMSGEAEAGKADFLSSLAVAAWRLPQEKGNPQQMINTLKKQKGAKGQEINLIDWSGLMDKKSITKQELVDYINEKTVRVKRTDKAKEDIVHHPDIDLVEERIYEMVQDEFWHNKTANQWFEDAKDYLPRDQVIAKKFVEDAIREAWDENQKVLTDIGLGYRSYQSASDIAGTFEEFRELAMEKIPIGNYAHVLPDEQSDIIQEIYTKQNYNRLFDYAEYDIRAEVGIDETGYAGYTLGDEGLEEGSGYREIFFNLDPETVTGQKGVGIDAAFGYLENGKPVTVVDHSGNQTVISTKGELQDLMDRGRATVPPSAIRLPDDEQEVLDKYGIKLNMGYQSGSTSLMEAANELRRKRGNPDAPENIQFVIENLDTRAARIIKEEDASVPKTFLVERPGLGIPSQHHDVEDNLFWARATDKTGPNGEKLLMVEEIQTDEKRGQLKKYLPKDWKKNAMQQIMHQAREEGYDGVVWAKDPEQVADIENWGGVYTPEGDEGKFYVGGGRDVTPIVRQYTDEMPAYAKEITGEDVQTIQLPDRPYGEGRIEGETLNYMPVGDKQITKPGLYEAGGGLAATAALTQPDAQTELSALANVMAGIPQEEFDPFVELIPALTGQISEEELEQYDPLTRAIMGL